MNDPVNAIFEPFLASEPEGLGEPDEAHGAEEREVGERVLGDREAREPVEPVTAAAVEPVETVDGVPVLAEARPLVSAPAALPAVQAAAVAATGFVAGAATLALVRRHSARKAVRRSATRRAADMLPIVGSRTFIVDVHLLAKPE